jgi:hypothetical protein
LHMVSRWILLMTTWPWVRVKPSKSVKCFAVAIV